MATAKKSAAKTAAPKQEPKDLPVAQQGGAMVVESDQVPDYIKKQGNRGSENVTTEDITIPRLEVLQALSPALDPRDSGYVEGAKLGDLINSVTKQIYGNRVMVVPIMYTKQFLVWKDRKNGGGFFGAYPTPAEAKDRADQEGGEKQGVTVIDTPQHFCLLLSGASRKPEEIMISMPRTKAKVSRQWNSMIKLIGGDRFGRVYIIGTAQEENDKGKFANFTVAQSGFPTQPVYKQAEALYEAVAGGKRTVVMDTSGMDDGGTDINDPDM